MLFVKRRRILVTCSRRLENPAGLRLSPSLSFFLISGILVMQMRGGGTSQPLYKGGRAGRPGPAAQLPSGQRGRPPRCRATGPRDLSAIFFLFFAFKSLPPGSEAAGVYFCKFPNRKYIFVKNENKKNAPFAHSKLASSDPHRHGPLLPAFLA